MKRMTRSVAAFDRAVARPGSPREIFRRLIHAYIDYACPIRPNTI